MSRVILAFLANAVLLAAPARAQSWSASDDFSPTNNPNGAWRYGYETALGGAFTDYNVSTTLGTGLDFWRASNVGNEPNLFHNSSENPVEAFDFVLQPDQTAFHPGPTGQFSVFRWTAPRDGLFSIHADFVGLGSSSTTDPHVLINGVPLFNGTINGQGMTTAFDIDQSLVTGDIVDFAVGFGSNGTFVGDTTGINAMIMDSLLVPEPSTLLLFVFGGLTLVWRRVPVLARPAV